jgi:hypothetical protein
MEAVMCLRPGVALAAVADVLARHRVRAEPMHPGATDPLLAPWYALHAPSSAALLAVVQALQQHPGVDAAYARPEGEAPGDLPGEAPPG